MNFKLDLLKIVPLATITIGLLAPVKMVIAAGSSAPTETTNTNKHEVVKGKEAGGGEYHAAESSAGGEHHGAAGISEILLSPKGQQIEFLAFCSVIGLSLIVPELFYRPKKNAQNLLRLENNKTQQSHNQASSAENSENTWQSESENHQHSTESHVTQTRLVNHSQDPENIQEETQKTKQDYPVLKFTTDNTKEPYTIPNKEIVQFDANSKIKLDNWSQPDREAA